jgi:nucleotide-binding universal stress UspA family protein
MDGTKLVIATDLSEHAAPAARWARDVAERAGLEVTVGYVVPLNVPNWISGAYELEENPEVRQRAEAKAIDWYRDATGEDPADVDVRAGTPRVQLSDMGRQDDVAALVVGMSGKGALGKILVGSTASALAQEPPCPVVIVHPEHPGLEPGHTITVGTDFSPAAEAAVEFAADLSETLSERLRIVYASTEDLDGTIDVEELPDGLRPETIRDAVQQRLDDLEARCADRLSEGVETTIAEGSASKALSGIASDTEVGIAVVGQSHRGSVTQSILGSVALKLLQGTPASLIVVPEDRKQD